MLEGAEEAYGKISCPDSTAAMPHYMMDDPNTDRFSHRPKYGLVKVQL